MITPQLAQNIIRLMQQVENKAKNISRNKLNYAKNLP